MGGWAQLGLRTIFCQKSSQRILRLLWLTALQVLDGVGGEVLVFLFVQIWKCCHLLTWPWESRQSWRLVHCRLVHRINKDESERMWFQFRNSGKDLQTVMDTSGMIFCVQHNFDQVSQKKRKRLVWNVLDDYQVRLSEERRGWSRCCLTRWFYQQTLAALSELPPDTSLPPHCHYHCLGSPGRLMFRHN